MRQVFILLLFTGVLVQNLQAQQSAKPAVFGQSFNSKNAIPAQALPKLLGLQDSVAVTVTGRVQQVCQAKGCWMDVLLADNSIMKVRFKDYGFFVPKDLAGKTVTINGMAYNKVVSVADQRHYAQDAGKKDAEIKAITQLKRSVTFTADGVMVK